MGPQPTLVETDACGRTALPGHPNQRFLMRVNEDGSILLRPAHVDIAAQQEYDSNPELQDLLARAAAAPTAARRTRHHH